MSKKKNNRVSVAQYSRVGVPFYISAQVVQLKMTLSRCNSLDSRQRSLSVCTLCVLPVSVWVLLWYSDFLPQSANTRTWQMGNSKLSADQV